jgi:hypothetical protein
MVQKSNTEEKTKATHKQMQTLVVLSQTVLLCRESVQANRSQLSVAPDNVQKRSHKNREL